jgi:hypothetical protein
MDGGGERAAPAARWVSKPWAARRRRLLSSLGGVGIVPELVLIVDDYARDLHRFDAQAGEVRVCAPCGQETRCIQILRCDVLGPVR